MINKILSLIVAVTSSPGVTPQSNNIWQAEAGWKNVDETYVFRAQSESIASECKKSPSLKLVTPYIFQGGHEIWADGTLIAKTIDRDFKTGGNYYSYLSVDCILIQNAKSVEWYSFSQSFIVLNLMTFPKLAQSDYLEKFFFETLNIGVFMTLLFSSLLGFVLFRKKISNAIVSFFVLASLSFSISVSGFNPEIFGISTSQLDLQKRIDSFLWLGGVFVFCLFYNLDLFGKRIFYSTIAALFLGLLLVNFSDNINNLQIGSNLAMITLLLGLFYAQGIKIKNIKIDKKTKASDLFLMLYIAVITYELLNTMIGFGGWPAFASSNLLLVLMSAALVNEKIVETYDERDLLRADLEGQVALKTRALSEKSGELEGTLKELRNTQAELVQSAKLASLGTLSAGIAHEINNSLNYVNASITPIEKIIRKEIIDSQDKAKALKMIALMKEGLGLTFDIIKNLKKQSATSASAAENLKLFEEANAAILLVKGKINSNIILQNKIDPQLEFTISRTAFSQVIMNLIVNAADAIESRLENEPHLNENHSITVGAHLNYSTIEVFVKDSGPGIPLPILDKLFDPFFTTKSVGKGTGLGLHIVRNEVHKFGGEISVANAIPPDHGAIFTITFPRAKAEGKVA